MTETAQPRFQSDYDCIVVGAGNGGLVAAVQMAQQGASVLLLEQHNLPGGFASSFVRGRFEFEASLHEVGDLGDPGREGSLGHSLTTKLGVEVDWVRVPEAYRIIFFGPGEELNVRVPLGVGPLVDEVERVVPGSRDAVERYLGLYREVIEAFNYLSRNRRKPDKLTMVSRYSRFLKAGAYSVQQVADAMGVPPKAQDILHGYWCYLGLPTDRVDFALFAAMVYTYIDRGAYIPRFRSHELATALTRRIRELGGEIAFNTKVERIVVEGGRVVAVRLASGELIRTRSVISNASPTVVYGRLVEPQSVVPDAAHRECNARIHGLSCFVVYLGLDASPQQLGLSEYGYMIMRDGDTRGIYDSFDELGVPEGHAAVCLNNAIEDCSPPGTTILSLTTLFRPNVWTGVEPRDYFRVKDRIAAGLVDQFEMATGCSLRPHIEEFAVATPQTMTRYTGAYKGSVYGYELEPWDSVIARLQSVKEEKHIGGLEFCGGFSAYGHGYSSSLMSGRAAALATVAELGQGEG